MQQDVTIANGGTNSTAIQLQGDLGSFQIPAAFTGATVTPQFSNDGTNFTAVGSAISVAANGTYAIPADCFKGKWLRLVSAGAEGAARTIRIFCRYTGQRVPPSGQV